MNRQYRGYSLTDKKWIYGDLIHYNNSMAICPIDSDWLEFITDSKMINRKYQVDPKSVGQSTGIFDRNDVEIFEGDIVEFNNQRLTVRYDIGVHILSGVCFINSQGFPSDEHLLLSSSYREVIGNIFENPELLK